MTVTPIRPMADFIEAVPAPIRPGSVLVAEWTGARADALLRAYRRYTIERFAAQLGVAGRTVTRWRANPQHVVSASCAEMLDTLLSRADAVTTARFVELTGIQPVADFTASDDRDDLRVQVAALTGQVEALTSLLVRLVGDGLTQTASHHIGTAVAA